MGATLNFQFRESWRDLRRGRPGHRFQDRYKRAKQDAKHYGPGLRLVLVSVALLALAIGVVFAVIPGPAIPFFLVAGGLLATESRTIARVMDWGEVRLRRVLAWAKRRWHRLPTLGRVALLVVAACGSAAMTYLTYRFLAG